MLTIDTSDLDNVVRRHSHYYFRVLYNKNLAQTALVKLEREKSVLFNDLSKHYRGREKSTAKVLDNLVRTDEEYLEVCEDLRKAQHAVNVWDSLASAFQSRGFKIREAMELMIASGGIGTMTPKRREG
jgi:hypothetical protein